MITFITSVYFYNDNAQKYIKWTEMWIWNYSENVFDVTFG